MTLLRASLLPVAMKRTNNYTTTLLAAGYTGRPEDGLLGIFREDAVPGQPAAKIVPLVSLEPSMREFQMD